jgi:hypothetical protein
MRPGKKNAWHMFSQIEGKNNASWKSGDFTCPGKVTGGRRSGISQGGSSRPD